MQDDDFNIQQSREEVKILGLCMSLAFFLLLIAHSKVKEEDVGLSRFTIMMCMAVLGLIGYKLYREPIVKKLSECNASLWNTYDKYFPSKEVQLEDAFDNLSLEQKKQLVEIGLAVKLNDKKELEELSEDEIRLKFFCPLKYGLMVKVGSIKVRNGYGVEVEHYDYNFIKKCLQTNNSISPKTKRELSDKTVFYDKEMNQELSEYKIKLRNFIENEMRVYDGSGLTK